MTLQTKEMKNRQFLLILSAITLVFFLISSLSTFFVQYRRSGLRFYFPGLLPALIFLLNFALRAITVFFFVELYKQEKSKLILTGVFGGYAVVSVFALISNVIGLIKYSNAAGILSIFICLLNIVVYGLYTLNVYQDGKFKVLALLPAILSLGITGLGFLGQIISFFEYLDMDMWFYAITNLAAGISTLAFALFMVVFVLSYGAPSAGKAPAAKASGELSAPERLQLLFQEYQKGNITEEQFQETRQKILQDL